MPWFEVTTVSYVNAPGLDAATRIGEAMADAGQKAAKSIETTVHVTSVTPVWKKEK